MSSKYFTSSTPCGSGASCGPLSQGSEPAPRSRHEAGVRSGRVALSGAGPTLGCLDLAVLGWGGRDEAPQQAVRGVRDLVDGAFEGVGVRLGGLRGAAHLAYVLERRAANLFLGRRWVEVV